MIVVLAMLAIFAEFCPNDFDHADLTHTNMPPQRIHFIDADGKLHLRPFTYNLMFDYDPQTFAPIWMEDASRRYPIRFFVKTWEYRFETVLHTLASIWG